MGIQNVQEKNPRNKYKNTPMHQAAFYGHYEICRLIVETVRDKNPVGYGGYTPLHYAAELGHLDVFNLILENILEKNPDEDFCSTFLYSSACQCLWLCQCDKFVINP